VQNLEPQGLIRKIFQNKDLAAYFARADFSLASLPEFPGEYLRTFQCGLSIRSVKVIRHTKCDFLARKLWKTRHGLFRAPPRKPSSYDSAW
jgi:hypothetical protein